MILAFTSLKVTFLLSKTSLSILRFYEISKTTPKLEIQAELIVITISKKAF